MGIGDWGLGIGDREWGIWDWAQSPIPNPQSPIPIKLILKANTKLFYYNLTIKKIKNMLSLLYNCLI